MKKSLKTWSKNNSYLLRNQVTYISTWCTKHSLKTNKKTKKYLVIFSNAINRIHMYYKLSYQAYKGQHINLTAITPLSGTLLGEPKSFYSSFLINSTIATTLRVSSTRLFLLSQETKNSKLYFLGEFCMHINTKLDGTRVIVLRHLRATFLFSQFWLKAVQGGAGTPAEWRQPAQDIAKWVTHPFGHWAHCWMLHWSSGVSPLRCLLIARVCSSARLLAERQGDDVSVLQAEARDTSRHYERSCKVHRSPVMLVVSVRVCVCVLLRSWTWPSGVQTLEELAESYRIHCTQLANTVSQYSRTQEEVRRIRYVCAVVSG